MQSNISALPMHIREESFETLFDFWQLKFVYLDIPIDNLQHS